MLFKIERLKLEKVMETNQLILSLENSQGVKGHSLPQQAHKNRFKDSAKTILIELQALAVIEEVDVIETLQIGKFLKETVVEIAKVIELRIVVVVGVDQEIDRLVVMKETQLPTIAVTKIAKEQREVKDRAN